MPDVVTKTSDLLSAYGLRLAAALAIFLLGKWAASAVAKLLEHSMRQARVEATLTTFVKNLSYALLLAFIVIAALGQLGVQTTSFVAVIGAAGLAIGLALQGSLSNLAAGVLVIIFQPFRVGDFVEAAGTKGTVEAIHIFHTILIGVDGRKQIIPNGQITSGIIIVGKPAG